MAATATEQAFPANPTYFAGSQIITSPFQFVADPDTFLRVRSACSAIDTTVFIQGRRLDQDGQLQIIEETHTPNTDRSVKVQDYVLGPGAILNLTAFASAPGLLYGQCYVMFQLCRNLGATAIVLGTLIGGYVTATQALGFPGSPVLSPLEGEGCVREVGATLPPAGSQVFETVPTGARWQFLSFSGVLTCNATVATRYPELAIDRGADLVGLYPVGSTLAAGQAAFVTWGTGVGQGTLAWPFPLVGALPSKLLLLSGWDFRTLVPNMQAGDAWSQPIYVVREWLEAA